MKIKLGNIISLMLTLVIMISYYAYNKNPNIIFIGNIILGILICLKCKTSIFSLKIIILNYVLIPLAFQFNTGKSSGILGLGYYHLNYDIANLLIYVYSLIIYLYITNTNLLKYENSKQKSNFSFSTVSSIFGCIIAIIFTFIAFPNLLFGGTRDRFDSLLLGHAWNHLVIISLLFAYPNLQKSLFVKISYMFCILWFLISGERVDMIGLIACVMFISITKKFSKIDKKLIINKFIKILKYGILSLVIVSVLVLIGEKRNANSISLSDIPRKILIQSTAADISYVYNISIKYRKEHSLMYGKSYINYLKNTIPIKKVNTLDFVLRDCYGSPGGLFLLSEPYMNFGILGIVMFAILECIVIEWILKQKSKYSYFLYLFILATQFRICWYGLYYIETGILYFIPLLYLIFSIIDQKMKKQSNFIMKEDKK